MFLKKAIVACTGSNDKFIEQIYNENIYTLPDQIA